jgi:hypothetical protein
MAITLVLMLASAAVIMLWAAGAIYYDVCRGGKWGRLLALTWALGVIALFVAWQPIWKPFLALLGVTAVFIVWWLRQKPSHNRVWDPSVAVLPWAVRAEDVVTIEGIRNFEYRSLTDFTPRYEKRTMNLSNLKSADLIFFNWGIRLVSHPVVVFDFGPDGRICLSIEVRYRKGQNYAIVRSLYRQQELIFVVADERDAILRRTKYDENEEALMYRLHASADELRTAFLDYIEAIRSLHETPRWYNAVCANCTTSFYRMPHSRFRFDWRVLCNGRLDRAFYEDGRLDRTLPFQELRQLASLKEIANSAPENGFGDYIRRELERRRHERFPPQGVAIRALDPEDK